MPRDNEQEFISYVLRGDAEAIEFCNIVFHAGQVWDDLIDGDRSVARETINNTFRNILVALPANRFYLANVHTLTPAISMIIHDWLDANELEVGDDHEKSISFVLRDTGSSLLVMCAELVGGYGWARSVAAEIRRHAYEETLEDYKRELEAGAV
jgi:hypothetical protein